MAWFKSRSQRREPEPVKRKLVRSCKTCGEGGILEHSNRHRMSDGSDLQKLHARIDQCFVCKENVPALVKPETMARGDPGRIVIVGIAPGSQEVKTNRAFSGQSGKSLDKWLIECGADPGAPRKGIYTTSVVKCHAPVENFLLLASRCRRFLYEQIRIIAPELVITLGEPAYDDLRFNQLSYGNALCTLQDSRDFSLITPMGVHFKLMTWPHPSGLNRWLNDAGNRDRLSRSFAMIRSFLQ